MVNLLASLFWRMAVVFFLAGCFVYPLDQHEGKHFLKSAGLLVAALAFIRLCLQ